MPLEFSKFVVPNAQGVPTYLYEIKDSFARAAIAGGMKFVFAWKGTETPDVTKIPDTVTVIYNNTAYTGTLTPSAAHTAVPLGFWLVSNGDGGNNGYAEYAPVEDDTSTPSTWRWEKFGDLALSLNDFGALAYMDSVELDKGNGVNVLGENATLQSQDSAVSFRQHSTKPALGASATFELNNPSVVPLRGRIKSASITPINGSENATVTNPTKKLKKKKIIPAKAKSISGSDVVTRITKKKLRTVPIQIPNLPESVYILNNYTKRKLATAEFPVSKKKQANNEDAPPTPYGLDIRMYDESIHGTIDGADEETLVLSFGTTPTLVLAQNPPRMATGSLVADGDTGTTAHDNYVAETGGEIVNSVNKTTQNMVTGRTPATVADGKLDNIEQGDTETFVGDIQLADRLDLAEPDTDGADVATGELVSDSDMLATGETRGAEVVMGNGSVSVPKPGNAKTVLLEEWDEATDNSEHINVMKSASLSGGSVTVNSPDSIDAIYELGAATAAAQNVTFANKDIKKVALYDDLKIRTESHPATRYLNFVTPAGGTITLRKIGEPYTVSLEKSFDGVNWQTWSADAETGERSVALAAGERLYLRNKSVTSARFSKGTDDYYQFSVPNGTEVNGIVESLICRTPELGEIGNLSNAGWHFTNLFRGCHITGKPIINSKVTKRQSLEFMFRDTSPLNSIEIRTVTKGDAATSGWLLYCANTGVIYATSSFYLTPNNASGVPNGWTKSII